MMKKYLSKRETISLYKGFVKEAMEEKIGFFRVTLWNEETLTGYREKNGGVTLWRYNHVPKVEKGHMYVAKLEFLGNTTNIIVVT